MLIEKHTSVFVKGYREKYYLYIHREFFSISMYQSNPNPNPNNYFTKRQKIDR